MDNFIILKKKKRGWVITCVGEKGGGIVFDGVEKGGGRVFDGGGKAPFVCVERGIWSWDGRVLDGGGKSPASMCVGRGGVFDGPGTGWSRARRGRGRRVCWRGREERGRRVWAFGVWGLRRGLRRSWDGRVTSEKREREDRLLEKRGRREPGGYIYHIE
ncbi:uncharacterized protein A4U43_C03F31320 [Asparagus officinalis]|uniref:Uncharacterized protein n=1 Tax=Asparagus officinalis TaxID=4686 RepID=A0A5P1FJF1_ASPOF|nr:uncharacterized protein A4U43_C03F31320 [Asparagus officinalis]